MSKSTGGLRMKNIRETYVEQLPYGHGLTGYMNIKRKPFTNLNSFDDGDIAYRSSPDYLRNIFDQNALSSTDMISERNIPRTKTANELALKSNTKRSISGNPQYKDQEQYYEEIQTLKKEMKALKIQNSVLRAKNRRLEEDNQRKQKEITSFYDGNKDGDLRATMPASTTDRNINNVANANVILRLKQRIFRLESQLKEKETKLDEIQSDPKWTKSKELEMQNRTLFGEIQRYRTKEAHNFPSTDYSTVMNEGKTEAIRKLTEQRDNYETENEKLKKEIEELKQLKPTPPRSSRDTESTALLATIERLKEKCKNYEDELNEMKTNLRKMEKERNNALKELDQATEEIERLKREIDLNKLRNNLGPTNIGSSPHQLPSKGHRSGQSSPNRDHFDSYSSVSKPSERQSTLSSVKEENVGNHQNRSRPTSASNSVNEPYLKIVQASFRGHLNRTEMDNIRANTSSPVVKPRTTPVTGKLGHVGSSDDDEDRVGPIKKSPSTKHPSANFPTNLSKPKAKPSSPNDETVLSKRSSRITDEPVSKNSSSLNSRRDLFGSKNRFPSNDRDSFSKQQPQSPSNIHKPSSPANSGRIPSHHKSPNHTPVKQTTKKNAGSDDYDDDDDVL